MSKKFKIQKFKEKVIEKFSKINESAQMNSIKFALKGMTQKQLEGVISICLNNTKPDEIKENKEIMDTIKEIYNKRGYKWEYD